MRRDPVRFTGGVGDTGPVPPAVSDPGPVTVRAAAGGDAAVAGVWMVAGAVATV
jgi:hypothetical protein